MMRNSSIVSSSHAWLLVLLVFTLIIGDCDGASRRYLATRTEVSQFKPNTNPNNNDDAQKSPNMVGHFMGFLPRGIPISASAPSRKHNDLGLQSWKSSP
uniref:Uncharacterized protein n=1 Tax=Kalanchoe fedtschenkoi TaxID=63787 RepID=A0A7N0V0U2_KALFE